ncbi:DedA family protein [Aquibium sp. LZ166]|uniref:DedA family protein n=1 Tax=Aquibium pacificus TaxID=3153579 RepID=A0ABV3SSA2_9HYPH
MTGTGSGEPDSFRPCHGWYRSWAGALTVTAGILRVPLSSFPVLATIDKTARYIVLALAILGLIAS